jgi:predicted acylesterase/phospholipase RssA
MDGILASTAIPPYFSPWIYRDKVLVDGGISDNLPISVAVEKKSTEIYALDIVRPGPIDDGHWNVLEVATLSLKDLIAQQRNRDLSLYSSLSGITLHYVPLSTSRQIGFDDFDHASELIEDGRKAAVDYLKGLQAKRGVIKETGFLKAGSHRLKKIGDFLTNLASRFKLSSQT